MDRTPKEKVESVAKAMRYLASKRNYRVRCKAGDMTLEHYTDPDLYGGWCMVAKVSVTKGYQFIRHF